jgi:hypothetical protein
MEVGKSVGINDEHNNTCSIFSDLNFTCCDLFCNLPSRNNLFFFPSKLNLVEKSLQKKLVF